MKQIIKFFVFACIGMVMGAGTVGAQQSSNELSFVDPWIRGSVPGQKNGAGYLVINNSASKPTALVAVQSERANRVELHTIVREDGVAKMREVKQIDVPAKGSVTLQPGGFHIMFIGLKQPFNEGEKINLNLKFADGQSHNVAFVVKSAKFMGNTAQGQGMVGHGKMGH